MMRWRTAIVAAAMALIWGQPGWSRQDDPKLDGLFAALAATEDARELSRLENAIWLVWLESGDSVLDDMMRRGVVAMNEGDFAVALVAFNTIIEAAPDFAEGWNKRATLYWLMGNYEASLADIDRTLALEPRHFGALSGLAMIRAAQGRDADALEAMRLLLLVHPHSPGARARFRALEEIVGPET